MRKPKNTKKKSIYALLVIENPLIVLSLAVECPWEKQESQNILYKIHLQDRKPQYRYDKIAWLQVWPVTLSYPNNLTGLLGGENRRKEYQMCLPSCNIQIIDMG